MDMFDMLNMDIPLENQRTVIIVGNGKSIKLLNICLKYLSNPYGKMVTYENNIRTIGNNAIIEIAEITSFVSYIR